MDREFLDSIQYEVLPYDLNWAKLFEQEKEKLKQVFNGDAISIEHIGSTSVPGLSSRPIIDIAVLITSYNEAKKYIAPLVQLGYEYDQPASSPERYFLRKYGDSKYHLSITYKDRGSFWKRQILFRDYLRDHEDAKKEYQELKLTLIKEDATGRQSYIQGRSEFIQRILTLAETNES